MDPTSGECSTYILLMVQYYRTKTFDSFLVISADWKIFRPFLGILIKIFLMFQNFQTKKKSKGSQSHNKFDF